MPHSSSSSSVDETDYTRDLQIFLQDLSQISEREAVASEIQGEDYFGPEKPHRLSETHTAT